MLRTVRIITWASLLLLIIYSILPTYVVNISGDGTGKVQPHDTYFSTLANRTFHLPGAEDMDGDFHHHDSQGNDLIRVEKKSAVIRACDDFKPHLAVQVLVPSLGNIFQTLVHDAYPVIGNDFKQRVNDGFFRLKTGHSPPVFPL